MHGAECALVWLTRFASANNLASVEDESATTNLQNSISETNPSATNNYALSQVPHTQMA